MVKLKVALVRLSSIYVIIYIHVSSYIGYYRMRAPGVACASCLGVSVGVYNVIQLLCVAILYKVENVCNVILWTKYYCTS